MDRNQWWELFDQKTARFYYYNASTQQTAWHRPQHCDIIPLAKLQTLRQNTEVPVERHSSVRKEISTQTPSALQAAAHSRSTNRSHSRQSRESAAQSPLAAGNGHHRYRQPVHSASAASSPSTIVVNPGYEQQESPAPVHQSRRSPQPQRSLAAGRGAPHLMHVRSPEDQVMMCDRPGALDGTSRGRQPCFDDDALVRASAMRSPVQPGTQSPFGFVRPDGFAVGGNPTLESLYFSNVGPPSPEPWEQCTSPVNVVVPKTTRAFPRTNPAYVGSRSRDGARPSYRKIDIDQQNAPSSFAPVNSRAGRRLVDDGRSSGDGVCFDMAAERRRAFRHERSDSDTSHSSFGISRLQQPDPALAGFPLIVAEQKVGNCRDAFSDSQGSLSQLVSADSLSSHGSSRGMYVNSGGGGVMSSPHDSLSSRDSPRRVAEPLCAVAGTDPRRYQLALHLVDKHSQSAHSTPTTRVRVRRNSEPDYANLPMAAPFHPIPQTANIADSYVHKLPCGLVGDEQRSGGSMQSADSLSPVEFVKQHDTPNSVHSAFTHDSTASNTSEGLPDQGFEDSDNSSIFSSPSPKSRQRPSMQCSSDLATHNASVHLRQRATDNGDDGVMRGVAGQASNTPVLVPSATSPVQRPLSFVLPFPDETCGGGMLPDPSNGQLEIERFLMENLNEHRKGLLGKTVPIGNMLTWTKNVISKPMIRTADKLVKKDAVDAFKLLQSYMGDRKAKAAPNCIALEIVTKGWGSVELRDEIYLQLCRQTNGNPRDDSLIRGWELISVCLSFFPPSFRFHSCLDGYIGRSLERSTDQGVVTHFVLHCQRRLDRIGRCGAKRGLRRPTVDEVDQALPSMFGNTLDEIMLMQAARFPDRKLPWLQTTLSEEVLRLNGACVEGIFRVPGDVDEVNSLKASCDEWIAPTHCSDAHTPASLLKLWYRELYEPLIPAEFYDDCVTCYGDVDACLRIVDALPAMNRRVLSYLIRFLQVFAAAENAAVTKMDASNLAMVMAPNCLRCESDDPNLIFENTRKEMAFMRVLIVNMDTSFMDGII